MARTADRDLIVVISSTEGWKYPLARLVTDTEGNAAVFTKRGQAPIHTFTLAPGQKVSPIRDTVQTTEGPTITYRRRGASCGWQLAKCNVKTPALLRLWPTEPIKAEPAQSPAQQTTESVEDLIGTPTTPPDMSQATIRAWAKANHYRIAEKGRIPNQIIQAYKAAHTQP